jgi:hypothetical protein
VGRTAISWVPVSIVRLSRRETGQDRRVRRWRLAALHTGLLTAIYGTGAGARGAARGARGAARSRPGRARTRGSIGCALVTASGSLLRHDRRRPTTCWGFDRRGWLGRRAFELAGQQQAFDDRVFIVDQSGRPPHQGLEGRDREDRCRRRSHRPVRQVGCMRGICMLTAVGLICKVGDFDRFDTTERFMSYAQLVP